MNTAVAVRGFAPWRFVVSPTPMTFHRDVAVSGSIPTSNVGEVVTAADGFWAVEHDAELIGYCCFGAEARVPGVGEESRHA